MKQPYIFSQTQNDKTQKTNAVNYLFLLTMLIMTNGKALAEECKSPSEPYKLFSKAGIKNISSKIYQPCPKPGKLTPQRAPNVEQDKLLKGEYKLQYVLEAGQNQFNLPFIPEFGAGEGALGPRHLQRQFWNPRGGTFADPQAWPFLRVNGIDSQSCYECHNSIGVYISPDSKTTAKVRKPSAQGGTAGVASNAFINDRFPENITQLLDPNPKSKSVLTKHVRNPPHVFGTGYTQRLATEMTTELLAQAQSVHMMAIRNIGQLKTIKLQTKGIYFGVYSEICSSETNCFIDKTRIVGIQGDLVVRPFQWGGITSSVRHFVRDALDFHFSIQAVEKVGHKDCDLDGLNDEFSVGNVTALTAYVSMFRPPYQVNKEKVEKGQTVFQKIGCIDCHSPSLTINSPLLTIMTPEKVPTDEPCPMEIAQLSNASTKPSSIASEAKTKVATIFERKYLELLTINKATTPTDLYELIQPQLHNAYIVSLDKENYQIDLSLTNQPKGSVPAYVWPRLPVKEGKVTVPLFSDLKTHFMGQRLADDYAQATDNPDYAAQPGHYVTRALWGVADTAPYLHDGRARTLQDAINLHGVQGSEAKLSADLYKQLSINDQQSLIDFLQSLKLPIAKGVNSPEYASR